MPIPETSTRSDTSENSLEKLERDLKTAWSQAGATPFLAEAPISTAAAGEIERAARQRSLPYLLAHYPLLGMWSVLTGLKRYYVDGQNGRSQGGPNVYEPITRFTDHDLQASRSQAELKEAVRRAARKIGLPIQGNKATGLLFAPLGPARGQHGELARAFVRHGTRNGPPAIEDTASARAWQAAAVRDHCAGHARLQAAIAFDASAHCALRFDAWRRGEAPIGADEASLFDAYRTVALTMGRIAADFVAPPRILWQRSGLALEAERSRERQTLKVGLVPTMISDGHPEPVGERWPDEIEWQCADRREQVRVVPAREEVFVFDAATGRLLATGSGPRIQVAATDLVIVSGEPFTSSSDFPSEPTLAGRIHVGWIHADEAIRFGDGRRLTFEATQDISIRVTGAVIARSGSRPLHGKDAVLECRLMPGSVNRDRIVRATSGDQVLFRPVRIDDAGQGQINLAAFGWDGSRPVGKIAFELLAPGAVQGIDARVELRTSAWVWTAVAGGADVADTLPLPPNYVDAHSAGLRVLDGVLRVDPRAEVETPILGLEWEGRIFEFALAARAEKLWRHRSDEGWEHVPKGKRLVFGHEARHDALKLRSPDGDADLFVLGRLHRRPFLFRQTIEIGAADLEACEGGDDRIALRRADGCVDVLARIERRPEPSGIGVEETDARVVLTIHQDEPIDAIRVVLAAAAGPIAQGDCALERRPVEHPMPNGVEVAATGDRPNEVLRIEVDKTRHAGPARVSIHRRLRGEVRYDPVTDAEGAEVAIGLGGTIDPRSGDALGRLACFAAEAVPAPLAAQVQGTIGRAYAQAMRAARSARMVRPVLPALKASRSAGKVPWHDIVGVAPWAFEAAGAAYQGLSEDTGLGQLELVEERPSVADLPKLGDEDPLAAWLVRLGDDGDIPGPLGADRLRSAMKSLRRRLREGELRRLRQDGAVGRAACEIAEAWSGSEEHLRAFDTQGGSDTYPIRLALVLERFARACAEKEAEAHVEGILLRTGLPRDEAGVALTAMLRAGVEVFVYFRSLWGQAAAQAKERM